VCILRSVARCGEEPRPALCVRLVEQRLGALQVGGVEVLGEPAVISASICDHLRITAPNHPWIE